MKAIMTIKKNTDARRTVDNTVSFVMNKNHDNRFII